MAEKVLEQLSIELGYDSWKDMQTLIRLTDKKFGKGVIHNFERCAEIALNFSIEEIKKMQKRWDKNENCPFIRRDPELCNKNQTCVYCVLEHLLSAVRLQASQKEAKKNG